MDNKTHLYFMPGLAASSKIFEYLNLPNEKFELHFLNWLIPESIDETLDHYVKRLCTSIKHTNPILIGVSFGGIIVQEMSKYVHPEKVILISSIKNNSEKPKRIIFLQKTKFYKLFPANIISKIENFSTFSFNKSIKKKLELYNKYLAVRDKKYLNWAIHNVINWERENNINNILHIHGSDDEIFPIKHIKNSIVIEGGTHAMIITKAKKINTILEEIIT
ncbi:MAG: alpha/beta hydrolase [Flavobacteriaceae bacterium]|nr:alpha/beta hydrolase [Flavobacteriaceae bacterium]